MPRTWFDAIVSTSHTTTQQEWHISSFEIDLVGTRQSETFSDATAEHLNLLALEIHSSAKPRQGAPVTLINDSQWSSEAPKAVIQDDRQSQTAPSVIKLDPNDWQRQLFASQKITVVLTTSPDCGRCDGLEKTWLEQAKKRPDVNFATSDAAAFRFPSDKAPIVSVIVPGVGQLT